MPAIAEKYRCYCEMLWAKLIRSFLFLFFIVISVSHQVSAQPISIKYQSVSADEIPSDITLETNFPNSLSAKAYLAQLPAKLQLKGYMAASIDSIAEIEDQLFVQLYIGYSYKWNSIIIADADEAILRSIGYDSHSFSGKIFTPTSIEKLYENILNKQAANGHPFAAVRLDSFSFNGSSISAKLNINSGEAYTIDSIIVTGDIKLNATFLYRHLGIAPHSTYNEEKINAINSRLLLLPYLQQSAPWQIDLLNTGAVLRLYLNSTRSNQVNILVGLLPNNDQLNGKLLFTGEANIALQNALALGETIGVVWQQLQPSSPRLNMQYIHPYFLGMAAGITGQFELYKRDSLYLNLRSQLGIQYEINSKQSGTVYFQNQRTNVLYVDTQFIKSSGVLPLLSDLSTTGLGAMYQYYNTDYRFNPRSGNDVWVNMAVGKRLLRRNNAITQIADPAFDVNKLYDSLESNTYSIKIQAALSHFFPLGRQSTIKIGAQAGWLEAASYFQNELFLVGGFKLLRGFDEEAVFANRYLVGTIEYRLLIDRNSRLFAFTDLGTTYNQAIRGKQYNSYLGIGAGVSVETNTGILSFSLAAGKQNDNPFDTRQLKLHFGFVSLF